MAAKAHVYHPGGSGADSAAIDSAVTVSLLTAAPGPQIYQLEGHTGLRLQFEDHDVVANWGLFDFSAPNFVYRFVKGETDYCVGLWPTSRFLVEYETEGREVTEQVLNLTPEQSWRLIRDVLKAVTPEERVYRYNYVLDNCATRPVAFLERAIGDSIRFSERSARLDGDVTFRKVMQHFHQGYPWYQFGIDLALGSGIDYPISVRQSAFAPDVLREIAATATIGDSVKLVKSTRVLLPGRPGGVIPPPTPWYLTPLFAAWAFFAIALSVCLTDNRKKRLSLWFQGLSFLIIGLAGCIIAFLVFISVHEATSPNWLILWLNPLALMVPVMIWWPGGRHLLRYYMKANLCLIALYAITWACGSQYANPAFLPIVLTDTILSLTFLKLSRSK